MEEQKSNVIGEMDPSEERTEHFMPLCIIVGLIAGFAVGQYVMKNLAAGLCFGTALGLGAGFVVDYLVYDRKKKN